MSRHLSLDAGDHLVFEVSEMNFSAMSKIVLVNLRHKVPSRHKYEPIAHLERLLINAHGLVDLFILLSS